MRRWGNRFRHSNSRARDRLNATVFGLAINLIALIVTNLSIIVLIIRAAT